MKDYESDRYAGTSNEALAASTVAGAPKRAAYAGHTPLEQMHLDARFRTKSGMPLDANVPPLSALQTPDENSAPAAPPPSFKPQGDESAPRCATPLVASLTAPSKNQRGENRQCAPQAGASGIPEAYPSEPLPGEPESSSLHTMLIGSLITASVAIGLSSSLWLNSLDKSPRSQNEISLWEAPSPPQADTAAASGSMTDEITSQMKNGVKNAMSGVGHWLLTSFGLAPQVKPSVASNASQGGAAPAAVGDKRSLPSDGEDAIALLPPDNPNKSAPRPTLLPDADPVDRSVSLSSQPPINASEALRDEPAPEKTKPSSARAASASEIRAVAKKKKSDEREASTHAERKSYKSGAKGASKSRHSSATVARSERTDEIGRLKSQAFSETTSDRIKDRKSKQRPPLSDYIFLPQSSSEKEGTPARNGKATKVKEALGQCQHRSNFFRREYCKWQVCDGRWGKYGCPSFENKTASY